MIIRIAFIISLLSISLASRAGITLTYPTAGSSDQPIHIDAPASSGLNGGIYVVNSVSGLRLSYTGNDAVSAKWQKFSALGAAYAEEVQPSGHDVSSSWLDSPEGDMGYVIQPSGSAAIYLWLTDYGKHPFKMGELTLSEQQDCGRMALDCSATAGEITYYSINGRSLTLSRDITLSYNTLTWDENLNNFAETPTKQTLEYLPHLISVEAPLCPTSFTLEGDRFLTQWGQQLSYISPEFQPRSVNAHTETIYDNTTSDNEISQPQSGDAISGSAPLTVTFSAKVTDAAIFHEWQLSRYPDFDDITLHAQELDFTHTFTEQGVSYIRFYCTNDDASCDYYSETYQVSIGTSVLKCPNVFTPYNQDGVNDIWKVTYASLIEFECHIFNRSGKEIASFSDPASGWDGRYNGKFVPTGVYYYVIKARGADGRDYKLAGDINILEYK